MQFFSVTIGPSNTLASAVFFGHVLGVVALFVSAITPIQRTLLLLIAGVSLIAYLGRERRNCQQVHYAHPGKFSYQQDRESPIESIVALSPYFLIPGFSVIRLQLERGNAAILYLLNDNTDREQTRKLRVLLNLYSHKSGHKTAQQ
ncbi:MAG: protein YgfX [bacterium]